MSLHVDDHSSKMYQKCCHNMTVNAHVYVNANVYTCGTMSPLEEEPTGLSPVRKEKSPEKEFQQSQNST